MYITQKPNYSIATGNKEFDSVQLSGSDIVCSVSIDSLNSADASLELQQSVDDATWGVVPDSAKTLAIAQPSHAWNVRGLVRGAFLRVALKKGTATAGTITDIKILASNG